MEAGAGFDTRICEEGPHNVERATTTNAKARRKNLSLLPARLVADASTSSATPARLAPPFPRGPLRSLHMAGPLMVREEGVEPPDAGLDSVST